MEDTHYEQKDVSCGDQRGGELGEGHCGHQSLHILRSKLLHQREESARPSLAPGGQGELGSPSLFPHLC